MRKSDHATSSTEPRAAAQPIIGGSAPGNAPTTVASDVRGFIGDKYKPNYLAKVFNLQLFMTLRGAAGTYRVRNLATRQIHYVLEHRQAVVTDSGLLAE